MVAAVMVSVVQRLLWFVDVCATLLTLCPTPALRLSTHEPHYCRVSSVAT